PVLLACRLSSLFFSYCAALSLLSFPTRRSSDLAVLTIFGGGVVTVVVDAVVTVVGGAVVTVVVDAVVTVVVDAVVTVVGGAVVTVVGGAVVTVVGGAVVTVVGGAVVTVVVDAVVTVVGGAVVTVVVDTVVTVVLGAIVTVVVEIVVVGRLVVEGADVVVVGGRVVEVEVVVDVCGSGRIASVAPLVAPATGVLAGRWDATKGPSAERAGPALTPLALTRSVVAVCRSWTNTSVVPFVSPATRLVASLWNATKRPSAESAGPKLTLLPSVPSEATLTRTVRPVGRPGRNHAACPLLPARPW